MCVFLYTQVVGDSWSTEYPVHKGGSMSFSMGYSRTNAATYKVHIHIPLQKQNTCINLYALGCLLKLRLRPRSHVKLFLLFFHKTFLKIFIFRKEN